MSRNINEIGNELWRMMTTFFQILSKAYNTVIEWIPLPSTESMKQWAWSIVGLNDKPLSQSTQYKMDKIDDIATKSVPVGCGLLAAWGYWCRWCRIWCRWCRWCRYRWCRWRHRTYSFGPSSNPNTCRIYSYRRRLRFNCTSNCEYRW